MTTRGSPWTPGLLSELARAAVEGPWRRADLAERLAAVVGSDSADRVATVLVAHVDRVPWGPVDRVAAEFAALPDLATALAPVPIVLVDGDATRPPVGAGRGWRWPVAPWTTTRELAHGLDLSIGELEWLADANEWLRRRPRHSDGDGGARSSALRHHRYRWVSSGSGIGRLLEAPRPLLAERQRRVARRVLAAIPVHDAAHGFVPGRSVATFADPHAGQPVVVRLDLEGFFTTVTATRVRGLLDTAGYPDAVARLLAGLLTTATPVEVLRAAPGVSTGALVTAAHRRDRLLATPHLAQGAPSSPAVANRISFGLDRRLTAWAASRGLRYTRYADDLAFSGPAATDVVALLRTVGRIVVDEGFRLQPGKTRVMRQHRRQRLAGLVVNARPAAPRADYDRLRAILHNAARTGPAAQNRDGHPDFAAHLRGRIAWIASTHAGRGRTLQDLFDRIDWDR